MQIVVIVLKMIIGIVRRQNRNIKDNGSSPWRGSPEPFYPPLPLPDPASEGRRRRRSLPRTSNLLPLLGSHPFLILRIRIPSLFPSPPPHSLPLRAITLSHILACHFPPSLKQMAEHETRPSNAFQLNRDCSKSFGLCLTSGQPNKGILASQMENWETVKTTQSLFSILHFIYPEIF